MTDLRHRFQELDQLDAPDMRGEIERRAASGPASLPVVEGSGLARWRKPLVAVAWAAAVVLLFVGGMTWLLIAVRGEPADDIPATDVVPTTVVDESATVATTLPTTETSVVTTVTEPVTTTIPPTPASLEVAWQRVEAPAFEGGVISAVTEGGPGLVAVGGSRGPDPQVDPSDGTAEYGWAGVWVSEDGLDWEQIESPVLGGEMSDVTMASVGVVAVGEADGRAAVWVSEDGRTWTRIPHDDAVFGTTESSMDHVVAASFGLLAIGTAGDEEEREVVSWVSSDGLSWTRAGALGPLELFSDDPLGYIPARLDVVAWRDEVFVVGSGNLGEPWTYRAAVWITDDGADWEMIPDDGSGTIETDPDVAGMAMVSVTENEDNLVALGWAGDIPYKGRQDPAVWTSTDGRDWTLMPGVIYGDPANQLWGEAVISDSGRYLVFSVADETQGSLFGSLDDGGSWHGVGSLDGGIGVELAWAGDEIYWTVNDLISIGDSMVAAGGTLSWSSTEDLGGRCGWDPGDGSAGSCRTDAAVWIATFEQ